MSHQEVTREAVSLKYSNCVMNRFRFKLIVPSVALIPVLTAASPASIDQSEPSAAISQDQIPPRYFVCVKLTSRLPLESPNVRIYPQSVTPYGSERDVENVWLNPVNFPSADIRLTSQSENLKPSITIAKKLTVPNAKTPTEAVPEPASLVPFILGGLLLRRPQPRRRTN